MASFLKMAGKKTTDIRTFLREAAGSSSVKYVAEKGQKHNLYIPYQMVDVVDEQGTKTQQKQIYAVSGSLHDWTTADGKYGSTICLKGVVNMGPDGNTLINDGSCPFCDRKDDAWDIVNYRYDAENSKCALQGDERKKYLEKVRRDFMDERKVREARDYVYMLVAKLRTESNGKYIEGQDGLPEYDLKVMRLSTSRADKIQQQVENSGLELPGSEIVISYPNNEDKRLVVSQSVTAPIYPDKMAVAVYPKLLNKINADVAKFNWEELDKSFQEWEGMTVAQAKKVTDEMFESWDAYKKELLVNPSAKYLEGVAGACATTNPSLTSVAAPQVPGAAPILPGGAPTVPGGLPDVNSIFNGAPAAPSINI